MPIELKYLDGGGSLLVGTGTLTGREILSAINAVHETEEKTRAIVFQIGDFRLVEKVDISSMDIRRISERDIRTSKINPQLITAVVAGKDVVFGLSRMWQAYSDNPSTITSVFRSMDEAEQWVKEQIKLKDASKPGDEG